ncbi:hypothetical protein GE21DRAFT_1306971 [Neurospora crassa]|nr:hypothetical protein GE21DRAFT_1306971 [Neurospora crassa]
MAARGIASEVPVKEWQKPDNGELERSNDEPVEEQVPWLVCDMARGCGVGSGGQQGDNASSPPARPWRGTAQRRMGAGDDDGWLLLVFEKENGFRGWM